MGLTGVSANHKDLAVSLIGPAHPQCLVQARYRTEWILCCGQSCRAELRELRPILAPDNCNRDSPGGTRLRASHVVPVDILDFQQIVRASGVPLPLSGNWPTAQVGQAGIRLTQGRTPIKQRDEVPAFRAGRMDHFVDGDWVIVARHSYPELALSHRVHPVHARFLETDNSSRDMPTWWIVFVITPGQQGSAMAILDKEIDIYDWCKAAHQQEQRVAQAGPRIWSDLPNLLRQRGNT